MTPHDEPVRFREIAFAVTDSDSIHVEVDGDCQKFRRGDQQTVLEHIGPDRLCACDDAMAFVVTLAGEDSRVADPVWKLLDTCRLIDSRVAGRAIKRLEALCPSVPRMSRRGTMNHRLADLRRQWCGVEQETSQTPVRTETEWKFGPLGTGHETRVAVACFLADRRAANLVINRPEVASRRRPVPDPTDSRQVSRFLAGRFRPLRDDWDEHWPPPRDKNGQYSIEPRDWGLAGEADPPLAAARREWALRRYDAETRQTENARRHATICSLSGRTARDYGGLRTGGVTFQAPPGTSLLRVRLRDDLLRCYALLGLSRGWIPPVWLHDELRAGRDPAAGYVDALAQQDIPPGQLPDGYLRLPEPVRIDVVRRILEAIMGKLHEDPAAEYIAFGSTEVASLSHDDRKRLFRAIRWDILGTGWFGLNAYLDVPVIKRIASVVSDDTFAKVGLNNRLSSAYADRHPGDDLTRWEERAARTFLGRPAGLGTPERFWQILLDQCSDAEHRENVMRARRDPHFANQILSDHPVGLTGRIGPALPIWQIRSVEVELAMGEIRGQMAYALVRSECGLAAIDGSEFICVVPRKSIEAMITRLKPFLMRALQDLLGENSYPFQIIHAGVEIEELDEW